MNEITIKIDGQFNSGVNELAKLFEDWLAYNNFNVLNAAAGQVSYKTEEQFQKQLDTISKTAAIVIETTENSKPYDYDYSIGSIWSTATGITSAANTQLDSWSSGINYTGYIND